MRRALPSRGRHSRLLHENESIVPAFAARSVGDLARHRPPRRLRDAGRDDSVALDARAPLRRSQGRGGAGNYDKAVKLYERLEGRAAGSVLAQQAQIERAYYLWKSGEKAQALSTLERFIKLHPTSPALDYALYLQGLVNFNDNLGLLGSFASQDLSERDQQASRDSYQSFRQLTEQFPQSPYAEDARAADELHRQLARRLRGPRRALLPAPRRLRRRRQSRPAGGAGVPALAIDRRGAVILAQSYDRLGLVELRDDTERVLKANFPNATINVELTRRQGAVVAALVSAALAPASGGA